MLESLKHILTSVVRDVIVEGQVVCTRSMGWGAGGGEGESGGSEVEGHQWCSLVEGIP